jgi:hypothetical protein
MGEQIDYAALLRGPIMKVAGMGPLCVRCGADAVAVVSVRKVLQDRSASWPVCGQQRCHAGALTEAVQALDAISTASAPATMPGLASVAPQEPRNRALGLSGADERHSAVQGVIDGPHSRACGWRQHEHGADCHPNCPTCHGGPATGGVVARGTVIIDAEATDG